MKFTATIRIATKDLIRAALPLSAKISEQVVTWVPSVDW
jgi:hypothetical protein